ncbi:hypothetical protein TanjilG_06680 [Lupinus angustifolius]|uniref:Uncharacterized protein n=1 Tax=Lupinus angustifolius TaxID=3871 RepID=A0A1J7I074_LUPAN|nr:hypothetical protein TanjilG_06680 [Lupinus angustifolius]
MSAILIYSVYTLYDIAYQDVSFLVNEVFSLWAASPRRLGGLNYTTDNVGNVISISDNHNSPLTAILGLEETIDRWIIVSETECYSSFHLAGFLFMFVLFLSDSSFCAMIMFLSVCCFLTSNSVRYMNKFIKTNQNSYNICGRLCRAHQLFLKKGPAYVDGNCTYFCTLQAHAWLCQYVVMSLLRKMLMPYVEDKISRVHCD